MNTVKVNAYAKLNLTLDITGREGGYHLLDSLVTTVDVFDRIAVTRRKDRLIRVIMRGARGSEIPPEDNIAQKAGDAFMERFRTGGADIIIHKDIPLAAGMGGSSADSAGVIAGMGRLYGIADMGAMKTLADTLGSDTGYLLSGGLARMQGRGERISLLPFANLHFLVFLPRGRVLTRECYETFDSLRLSGGVRTEQAIGHLLDGNTEWAAKCFGNDLFPAACELEPAVKEAYLAAKSFSPMGVSMTGSGSAVFACFESRELCEWARSRYRGKCRTMIVRSIDPSKQKQRKSLYALTDEEQE